VPKHKLDALVTQLGSREAVVEQMLNGIIGRTPAAGVFDLTTTIEGQTVVCTGSGSGWFGEDRDSVCPMSGHESHERALSLREHAVLLWVLCELGEFEAAEALEMQSRAVSVVGGLPTMLRLSVPEDAPSVPLPDGPLPVRSIAIDEAGKPLGEVLIWISAGYLSALEYAWYTDDPPSDLPCPSMLRTG